jgi:hypothetical protein
MKSDQLNRSRAHQPLGPRSSTNHGPVQGQPRIFSSLNTGTDFQQEPLALKQGQPRIFATGNGQDSQPRNTNGQQSSGYGRGNQPKRESPAVQNGRTGDIKGRGVDRGTGAVQGFHQHQQQLETQLDQQDDQTSSQDQMGETPIRTMYTRAKSPAMQYRESLEKGRDWNRVGGNGPSDNKPTDPQSTRPSVRRATEPRFELPLPTPLRKDSSGGSNGPQQRFMGPRSPSSDHQQALNLNGDDVTSKLSRRQSLYSPVVSITTNVEEPELSDELSIPSPKPSPKTARSLGQRQDSAQHKSGRHQTPPAPLSFHPERSPPITNGYSSPGVDNSSPEPPPSRDSRGRLVSQHTQSSTANLSTQDPIRTTSFASSTSVSSDRERGRSSTGVEPQHIQSRLHKSTQPHRSDNNKSHPPPTHRRSPERLRAGVTQTNRGSQMDSFYGGEASLSGMKKLDVRNGEEAVHPYPLELHLLHPQLLRSLLQYLSFYDWCILQGVNKSLRSQLNHAKELKEEVLERYLFTIGYARWIWEEDEPLVVSLRVRPSWLSPEIILTSVLQDLGEYMRGVSLPTHEYARISDSYLQARASTVPKEEKIMHADQARAMSFATRAYSRIVVRLRAQAEAVMAHGGAVSKLPSGPATESRTHTRRLISISSSRAPSISSHEHQSSRPPNGQGSRMVFVSPIYQPKRAPLLRVFVPSQEDWLSDASVVECESELKRAGILHMLRPGDAVWDIAVGDEGNAGRMVWDGNFLLVSDFCLQILSRVSQTSKHRILITPTRLRVTYLDTFLPWLLPLRISTRCSGSVEIPLYTSTLTRGRRRLR